ncbi:MAG: hypothetical protein EBY31_03725, partial [Flavobacteriia bacterium]|nr:hypothetical protein [Flavobacteriia bacterium]
TIVFDLNQGVYSSENGINYFTYPVKIKSTYTAINALDFWFKFNESELTFVSSTSNLNGLDVFSNFNSNNHYLSSTASMPSTSNTIPANTNIMTLKFIVNGPCPEVNTNDFFNSNSLINGVICNHRFSPGIPRTAVINTTTASACDSYVWNGTTYTATGVYTGTTANCVTEKLNLTITPSSTNTTTTSAVATYTWTNNGQTYTTSGVYTGTTVNCVTQILNLTIIPTLSLQLFLDGYYINNSNPSSMRPARYNNLVASGSLNQAATTDVDIVTVELRSPSNLNVVAYSVSPILQANGSVQCVFPAGALGGSFYIVVKHRSSLPLWSANPVAMSNATALSFANNITNAYSGGSIAPMKTLVSGLYASRLGELIEDGYLDALDYSSLETDIYSSQYGGLYLLDGDLNGDSYVDASDYAVFDFNSKLGSYEQRPY